ncbi:hypothetical protein [Geoalkalibacter halelectricus]|uniref:hypothetical protein n=1 Tax=Geoalkalibacter halelectricus TaxID=2847045 RepID=UPI003D20D820
MKDKILIFLTFLFLIIIAPTLMFSMIAPHLMGTILLIWNIFVTTFTALGWSMRRYGWQQK